MDGYDTLARLAVWPARHDLALSALPDAPVRLPRQPWVVGPELPASR